MEHFHFSMHGRDYRTNADATVVEGKDGSKWNRTHSLSVILTAQDAVRHAPTFRGYDEDGMAIYVLNFDI